MAKARTKNPLEWVTDVIPSVASIVAGGTEANTNGRIQLLLDRDEVADIFRIITTIIPDKIVTNILDTAALVDEAWVFGYIHSTDPRVDTTFADAANRANLEDRNIFNYGFLQLAFDPHDHSDATVYDLQNKLGLSDNIQVAEFVEPLTVGGDIGWAVGGVHASNSTAADFITTVFFKRRRSTSEKANLIMLRR